MLTAAVTESVSVEVVPNAVESVSHAALSLIVHDNVPPVGFVKLKSWAAGLAPPETAEKLSAIGDIFNVGAAVEPEIVNAMGIEVLFKRPERPSVTMVRVVE